MPDSASGRNGTSRHAKMTAAAVWLAQNGAFVGWGAVSDGKAVNRKWKSDMTDDPSLIPNLLHGARNSVIVPARRLLVIDVDKPGWYERIQAAGLPPTFTVMSPSRRRVDTGMPVEAGYPGETFRGVHIYLKVAPMVDVNTIPGVFGGGETRRSDNGDQSMVLGPWAMRPDGIYEPIPGTPRVIAECPAEVYGFLVNHGKAPTKPLIVVSEGLDPDWQWDGTLGSRHDHLRDKIRRWRGDGLTGEPLMAAVNAYIDRHGIPLEREGGKTIDSVEVSRMIRGAESKFAEDPPETVPISVSAPTGPTGPTVLGEQTESLDQIVIDPLAIESRIERPAPFDPHQVPLPMGLAIILDHCRPLTDAPYSSLLLTSCVVMSALAGTAPTLGWRGLHRPSLFGVLVGPSGYGRKGATMRVVERVFTQVDPLMSEIEVSGIASGEVLVDILNESKTNTIGTSLIWEHEIANVLILASREGNIMSGNLRRAWDGDPVQSRSRAKGKSSASGYNVAFMGGVTPNELSKRLSSDDIANGWANRFLWFHSERRDGGFNPTADDTMAASDLSYLRDCISFARSLGGSYLIRPRFTMAFTPSAESRMDALAAALDIPPVGAIGALRQRMPGHVVRLAMVAAIFDQSTVVAADHVAFAEAMTGYAVDSMRSVFGVRIDDPLAMLVSSVLAQVPDHWMNTTDLRRSTGGKDHSRLMSAVRLLMDEGFVVREDRLSGAGKGGRPSVGYRLTGV